MAKRASIVIPFNYDESWTGGNYYILNLVASFNQLPLEQQPDVWILSHQKSSFEFVATGANYRRAKWISSLLMQPVDGGFFRKLRFITRLIPSFFKPQLQYDVVFPFPVDSQDRRRTVCWIPDFQERALPELFSRQELDYRQSQHQFYIDNFDHIVFSSHSAKRDFEAYYSAARNQTHVVQFAVAEVLEVAEPLKVLEKYELGRQFFYCPNQFWQHKNHKLVIEAVALLAKQGIAATVAFSGKELDRRAPGHAESLKAMTRSLGLEGQVKFLGFLPKQDQVALLRSATAIIQPSLFEGWSTVVEDAKAVSQFIIASDLPVHREQLTQNYRLFDPRSAGELASCMADLIIAKPPLETIDYDLNRQAFARSFLKVVDSVRMGEGQEKL
jgi:glycosyltransferase involved in cell wall biosynthesis